MKRLYLMALLVLAMLTGVIISGCTTTNNIKGTPEQFTQNLSENGFTVQNGEFASIDFLQLYNEGKAITCNGNNASNPYLACLMPKSPGQVVEDENKIKDELNSAFRLREDEAVVFVGQTPPQMKYFSYTAFLYSRYEPGRSPNSGISVYKEPNQLLDTMLANDRKLLFASVTDPINILDINTSGTPDGKQGDACDKTTMIIFVADKNTENKIRDAATKSGYPASIINTKTLPYRLLKLGIDNESDTISIGIRGALFSDQTKGQNYFANPNMKVFKVTPNEKATFEGMQEDIVKPRGNGKTEVNYLPAMEQLREAILTKYSNYKANELVTDIWINEGFSAIQKGVDNLAESRDTSYLWTNTFKLPDDPDSFAIAYGVNHAKSNKATYSNIVAYGYNIENGVATTSSDQFEGSANAYLPSDPVADYLYAWKITRTDDGSGKCLVVPTGPLAYGVPLDQQLFLGFRAYLEPATKIGPAWHEILFDKAIVFSRK